MKNTRKHKILTLGCLSLLAFRGTRSGNSKSSVPVRMRKNVAKRANQATFSALAPLAPVTLVATEDPSSFVSKLPSTVKGYYSDGTDKDFPVTWNTPTKEQTSKAGTFLLEGNVRVDTTSVKTSISITIKTVYSVGLPVQKVPVGSTLNRPKQAAVVYSDGSYELRDAVWDKTTLPKTDKKGEFTVKGSVTSLAKEFEAKVSVVGLESAPAKSISQEATASIDFVNSWDDKGILNDGKWDGKGLSNWETREDTNKDGYYHASLSFSEAKADIVSVTVYYWTGESNCNVPKNQIIEIDTDGKGNFTEPEYDVQVGTKSANDVTPYTYVFKTPVSAKAVRLGWNNSDGSGNQNGTWSNISEIAVNVLSGEVPKSEENTLSRIKVNGVRVANYDAYQNSHTVSVPYATKEIKVEYEKADEAEYVQRIEGEAGKTSWKIVVFDEGRTRAPRTYEIFVNKDSPLLKSVSLSLAGNVDSLKEGEHVDLEVKGTDEIGGDVTSSRANVSYQLSNLTGQAEIKGKTLYGITSGYVEITATMDYNGTIVSSEKKKVAINPSDIKRIPVSVEKTSASFHTGETPSLPSTVNVTRDDRSVREYPVTWNVIPESRRQKTGKFQIQGMVTGTTLRAACDVSVIGSGRVTYGSKLSAKVGSVPSLPSKLPYSQDALGNLVYAPVSFDSTRFVNEFSALKAGEYATAWYQFSNEGWNTIEYYAEEGGKDSTDYADRQNGYRIPASFASASGEGTDRAFSDGKSVAWKSTDDDPNPYIGFVFGNTGNTEKKEVNKAVLSFVTGEYSLPSSVKVQYYSGELTASDLDTTAFDKVEKSTSEKLKLSDSLWKDVSSQQGSIADKTTLTFDSVSTYAIRFLLTKDAGKNVSVNDLAIRGSLFEEQTTAPKLSKLNVRIGEKETNIYEEGKDEYKVQYDGKSQISFTPVFADGEYGSYTVLGDTGDHVVRITLISADGKETKTIMVTLDRPESEYKTIASIEQPSSREVTKAKDGTELNLPSKVKVNYLDGTDEELGVTFDTSLYGGKKGRYTFQGTIDRPLNVTNPLSLTVSIQVDVKEDYPKEVITKTETKTETITKTETVTKTEKVYNHAAVITLSVFLGIFVLATRGLGVLFFLKKKAK